MHYHSSLLVERAFELIHAVMTCTDKICRIQNILELYTFLVGNPEFLCHTPLFLENSLINVPYFQQELLDSKASLPDLLYEKTTHILQEFADLATYIQLITNY
jgi:hypothetical protein